MSAFPRIILRSVSSQPRGLSLGIWATDNENFGSLAGFTLGSFYRRFWRHFKCYDDCDRRMWIGNLETKGWPK
jgi:hypothetical protein